MTPELPLSSETMAGITGSTVQTEISPSQVSETLSISDNFRKSLVAQCVQIESDEAAKQSSVHNTKRYPGNGKIYSRMQRILY